jgi:hypothetical protein
MDPAIRNILHGTGLLVSIHEPVFITSLTKKFRRSSWGSLIGAAVENWLKTCLSFIRSQKTSCTSTAFIGNEIMSFAIRNREDSTGSTCVGARLSHELILFTLLALVLVSFINQTSGDGGDRETLGPGVSYVEVLQTLVANCVGGVGLAVRDFDSWVIHTVLGSRVQVPGTRASGASEDSSVLDVVSGAVRKLDFPTVRNSFGSKVSLEGDISVVEDVGVEIRVRKSSVVSRSVDHVLLLEVALETLITCREGVDCTSGHLGKGHALSNIIVESLSLFTHRTETGFGEEKTTVHFNGGLETLTIGHVVVFLAKKTLTCLVIILTVTDDHIVGGLDALLLSGVEDHLLLTLETL